MDKLFPSIWIGEYQSKAEYASQADRLAAAFSVYDWLDDRVLLSRHAFSYPAYCSVCGHVTRMQVDWTYGAAGTSTSINPAWTETARCAECGLNSRMRALIDFLTSHYDLSTIQHTYLAEQITLSYRKLAQVLPKVTGSEYLSPTLKSGKTVVQVTKGRKVRHEDLTALSFNDSTFDLVITQDVFEHVPDYRKSFSEIYRVLKPNGKLVFTIPFFSDLEVTRIRASVGESGIIHHLPAEIHGNPVSNEGSLCFQNFGWDILEDLRKSGFMSAKANMYWGPLQGHLGYSFFVFSASKS